MQEKTENRWLFLVVLAFILTMIGFTFYRYVVMSDYVTFTSEVEIPGKLDYLKSNI